jgi:hypothetical protein
VVTAKEQATRVNKGQAVLGAHHVERCNCGVVWLIVLSQGKIEQRFLIFTFDFSKIPS